MKIYRSSTISKAMGLWALCILVLVHNGNAMEDGAIPPNNPSNWTESIRVERKNNAKWNRVKEDGFDATLKRQFAKRFLRNMPNTIKSDIDKFTTINNWKVLLTLRVISAVAAFVFLALAFLLSKTDVVEKGMTEGIAWFGLACSFVFIVLNLSYSFTYGQYEHIEKNESEHIWSHKRKPIILGQSLLLLAGYLFLFVSVFFGNYPWLAAIGTAVVVGRGLIWMVFITKSPRWIGYGNAVKILQEIHDETPIVDEVEMIQMIEPTLDAQPEEEPEKPTLERRRVLERLLQRANRLD